MEICGKILPVSITDYQGRKITVRAYKETDLEGLRDMYDHFDPMGAEAGLPPPNYQVRRKWIDLMVTSFFNIIALHEDAVVGHAALDTLIKGSCPELLIFVKKEYRHCGTGTILSDMIKKIAGQVGCDRLWLNVRTGNAIAIKVFKKVGFKFVGQLDIQRDMELTITCTTTNPNNTPKQGRF